MPRTVPLRRIALLLVCVLVVTMGIAVVSRAQESPTPHVWSLVPETTTPTTDTVHFTVTFSEAVTGVDVSDFTTAGDNAGAQIRAVTATQNPAVYDVTVALGAAHTKLFLVLNDDDTIRNASGVPLAGAGASNGLVSASSVTYGSAPQVLSLIPETTTPTTDTVHFTVTFNQSVTGVDVSDFTTAGDNAGAQIRTVTATDNPAVYDVIVALGSAHTKLLLVINDDDTIRNTSGIPLGGIGIANGVVSAQAVTYTAASTTTVAVDPLAMPLLHTPQSGGIDIGFYNSLALTKPASLPVISYQDYTNDDLRLALCSNATCSASTIRTIDSTGNVGAYTSLALTSTNVPVISYLDATNLDLKLALCSNATCSASTIRTIDSTGYVGAYTSLAVTSTNLAVVSYYDVTNGDLKLALCSNATCSASTIRTIDSTGNVGAYPSLALTSTNVPVISYLDSMNGDLKLALCSDATCSASTIRTIDSTGSVGAYPSLALTSTNVPVISYLDVTNSNLKLALCSNATCSASTIRTIDSTGNVGMYSSLALTSTNVPVISYLDSTNFDLKLALCSNATCSASTIRTIDSTGNVGYSTSLKLLPSTSQTIINPAISYYDSTNTSLKYYNGSQTIDTLQIVDQGKPYAPTKLSPTNKVTGQLPSLTLKWASSLYASYYEYCYATSIDACGGSWNVVTNTLQANISGLTANTTYYWQVRAVNTAGTTDADGGHWSFKTAP